MPLAVMELAAIQVVAKGLSPGFWDLAAAGAWHDTSQASG